MERIRGITNEIFSLIITKIMVNFDVSQILNNERSLYDIMYNELFTKMRLRKKIIVVQDKKIATLR